MVSIRSIPAARAVVRSVGPVKAKMARPVSLLSNQKIIQKQVEKKQEVKKSSGFWGSLFNGIKKVAKAVGNAFKKVGAAVVKVVKGIGRTVKSAVNVAKNTVLMVPALLKGDWRAASVYGVKALKSVAQVATNSARIVLDTTAVITSPFHQGVTDKIYAASNRIGEANAYLDDLVELGDQYSYSLFYNGDYLEPWEVRDLPPQTGGKGRPADLDQTTYTTRSNGSDVSDLAKDLLEANAPIVRQFAHDSYPLQTKDILANSERRPDGSYDIKDSFSNNTFASHQYQPATYANATKVDDNIIKMEYTRYYADSYMSSGATDKLVSKPYHESDAEQSFFYFDLTKQEIVKAEVLKHGMGRGRFHTQEQIEFINGRPVITTALGAHATGITGGLERTDTPLAHKGHEWTGKWVIDNFPTREHVAQGKAIDLHFNPDQVIVRGLETTGKRVHFTEPDRWEHRFEGKKRKGGSNFYLPV